MLDAPRLLEFRAEGYNMFNHPQFQVPAAVINSGGAL